MEIQMSSNRWKQRSTAATGVSTIQFIYIIWERKDQDPRKEEKLEGMNIQDPSLKQIHKPSTEIKIMC